MESNFQDQADQLGKDSQSDSPVVGRKYLQTEIMSLGGEVIDVSRIVECIQSHDTIDWLVFMETVPTGPNGRPWRYSVHKDDYPVHWSDFMGGEGINCTIYRELEDQ